MLAYIRSLIGRFLHRSRLEDELAEELRSHIQHRADDLQRAGMERAAAERLARIEFGGQEAVKEECRQAIGGNALETFARDARFGARVLAKSPGFTLVAVGTLALAIGANAVVFAALNAVYLRPLDVTHPESLYSIHRVTDNSAAQSYPDYLDFRDQNRSFEDLTGYAILQAGLDTGANPSRVWLSAVTSNYFDVLGVQPLAGRYFHAADEHGANSMPYVVLSYAYWHTRFHDDPTVVGRVVQLNKHPFTILGIAPRGFVGTLLFFSPDFFMPLVNEEQIDGVNVLHARGTRYLFMTMGHLKPGVTPQQAADDLNAIDARLEAAYPRDHRQVTVALARPSLYGDYMGRPVKAFLTALMLLAGLILLAACANLGSLFAARAADRSREVALRLALGAGRLRILRQLFTEAVLIALGGGALGLWGSVLLLEWVAAWQPFPQFPINLPVSPDARVYVMALLLALASGLLFGAVPVRQMLRTDPYEIVKSGSRCTAGRLSVRDLLVAAQIAICAVLVTASVVAVRGLVRSMHADFGFVPQNAMLVSTDLGMAGYRGDAVANTQKRMIQAMESIPGVTAVGLTDLPPLRNSQGTAVLVFRDGTADLKPANAAITPYQLKVSTGYFRAAGTRLLAGRHFTDHDDAHAPRVAVVNAQFARELVAAGEAAVGRYFLLRDGARIQIVGIVEDGKYGHLTEAPRAALFLPILQAPSSDSCLVLRSTRDPQQLATEVRGKLRTLDPALPPFIQTWEKALDLALFPSKVAAVSLGLLGLMGAMLSITGIFGMAAYAVSRRMRELGIRIALGAQRNAVLGAALGRALRLLAIGSAAGLVLGILASRVLAAIVYQATPRDPVVLAGVISVMFALGLLATWIPAQRALSIDPLALLRED